MYPCILMHLFYHHTQTVSQEPDDLAREYSNQEGNPILFKLSMFLTQICSKIFFFNAWNLGLSILSSNQKNNIFIYGNAPLISSFQMILKYKQNEGIYRCCFICLKSWEYFSCIIQVFHLKCFINWQIIFSSNTCFVFSC